MKKENRAFFILGYLLLLILIYILPFKEISYSLSGTMTRMVERENAFKEFYVMIFQVFSYLSLIFLAIGRNKVIVILAIISSILNILSLPLIYFGLTFNLTFFGTPKQIDVAFGFYLLAILNCCLVIYSFYSFRFYPKISESKLKSQGEDLLDA